MENLANKTVLITGASRGIGASAAHRFSEAGANVVLLARGHQDIADLAKTLPGNALALQCDVSDFNQVNAAVQAASDQFGAIDILINNAGVIEPISHMAQADTAQWGKTIDINLKGVFHGIRAVLPQMVQAGGGTILNISSGAAHGPVEAWSAYCASKAGAAMLTRTLDHEERHHGIRAIGLSPGTVATQMQRDIKKSGINPVSKLNWSDHIPADWPARALIWMCGADADEFLGQDISLKDDTIRQRIGLIT